MKKDITILYVEDDFSIQKKLISELEYHADNVIVRDNGLQGLQVIEEGTEVDLIVTDIKMDKMDGIEMVKEIRKIDEEIPVIFTTAHNNLSMLMESIKLEAQGYILKPIDLDILENTIKRIIENIQNKAFVFNHIEKVALKAQKHSLELDINKSLVDNHILYIKTDVEGTITYVSQAFANKIGMKKSDILGTLYPQLWSGHTDPEVILSLKEAFLDKENWYGDLRYILYDGEEGNEDEHVFYVNSDMKKVYKRGKIIGYEIIQEDRTIEKALTDLSKEELNERMSKQLALIKGKFIPAMAKIKGDILKVLEEYKQDKLNKDVIDKFKSSTMDTIIAMNDMLYESSDNIN